MHTDEMPTCVIADDHDIVVQGLVSAIGGMLHVLARAATGEEAIELCGTLRPDILFLDVRMPGPGMEKVLTELRDAPGETRVIVFTSITAVERVRAAFDCGASGYISKDAQVATLSGAVEAVLAGKRFLDPLLAPQVIAAAVPQLTPREYGTLRLMADGAQNAAIALELGISDETVKSHISSILRKLGCISRTGAVAQAIRAGVMD